MGLHLYPLQQGLVRVKVSGWSSVSQSNVALVPLKNLSHLTLLCQMVTALITVSRPLPFQCLSSDVHTQPAPPAPPQHLHPGLFIIPLKTQASSDNRQRTTWTACDLLDVDCGIEKNADPPSPPHLKSGTDGGHVAADGCSWQSRQDLTALCQPSHCIWGESGDTWRGATLSWWEGTAGRS